MGIKRSNNPKIIVILGPTSSGKSDLAVDLALFLEKKNIQEKLEINGAEVISADSRQVYKGMNLGTGKITKKEMKDIPHHLLDIRSPKRRFTVSQFKSLGEQKIKEITKKNKVPIVCGGTAFYIKALVDGVIIPEVTPDRNLRKKLEKKDARQLFEELSKLDPKRAKKIDRKNKRRLIRAIEIVEKTKKPIPPIKEDCLYSPLFLGLKVNQEELEERIERRLQERIKRGMIKEVESLRESGVSWERLEELGLEYRWVAKYLQEKISYKEMFEKLLSDIKKFSKRQLVWWKHDQRIHWIESRNSALSLVENFLKE